MNPTFLSNAVYATKDRKVEVDTVPASPYQPEKFLLIVWIAHETHHEKEHRQHGEQHAKTIGRNPAPGSRHDPNPYGSHPKQIPDPRRARRDC